MRTSLLHLTVILIGIAVTYSIKFEAIIHRCRQAGCHNELCTDKFFTSCNDWQPEYTCYQERGFGVCERQEDGKCGWTATLALQQCLNNLLPACVKNGCGPLTCEEDYGLAYECAASNWDDPPYNTCWGRDFALCERQGDGACGWTMTPQLEKCNADYEEDMKTWTRPTMDIDEPVLMPVEEAVLEQAQCVKTGCRPLVCEEDHGVMYSCMEPSWEDPPANTCWEADFAICERQTDGNCGYTMTSELQKCNTEYEERMKNWTPPRLDEPIFEEAILEQKGCVKMGCSTLTCAEDEGLMFSCMAPSWDDPPYNTCWGRDFAVCERQEDGQCGFRMNSQLEECNAEYEEYMKTWTPPIQNEYTPIPIPVEEAVLEEKECVKMGCYTLTCAEDEGIMFICEESSWDDPPVNTCWAKDSAVCKRQEDGQCGWTMTPELEKCNAEYEESMKTWTPPPPYEPFHPIPVEEAVLEQKECVKTGCGPLVCAEDEGIMYSCMAPSWDKPPANTCWEKDFAICERQENGQCGYTMTPELEQCNANYEEFVKGWTPRSPNIAPRAPPVEEVIEGAKSEKVAI